MPNWFVDPENEEDLLPEQEDNEEELLAQEPEEEKKIEKQSEDEEEDDLGFGGLFGDDSEEELPNLDGIRRAPGHLQAQVRLNRVPMLLLPAELQEGGDDFGLENLFTEDNDSCDNSLNKSVEEQLSEDVVAKIQGFCDVFDNLEDGSIDRVNDI